MKIQLEELDLLQPWPTFTMRPGYYAVNVFVRMGGIPIGDVLVRPARKRLVTPRRLQRRIVKKYTVTLLKSLLREALTVGPSALTAIPEGAFPKHQMVTSSTPKNRHYVAEHILLPGGIPEPFRTWVLEAQQRQTWPLPPVTIAVCTRDRESVLEACVANLRQLDYPNFDILLVDNSRDPIPAREIAERLGVGYVRSSIPGLSRARNVAIEHARHSWVAFIDDDCRPERNWLKELVRPTQDGNCRCVCGLVRPAQLENSAEITFEVYGGLGRGYTSRIFDPAFLTASRIRPAHTWRIGAGANMLLHKAFAQSAGGFDTEMGPGPHGVGGCGEDTDFFYQVLRAGHNIHYAPRAVVHHLHRSSPKALRKQVYGYAVGHAAYHVRCLLKYRDYRSLLQLGWHLPVWFARNLKRGIYGKTKYPFSLVLLEARGTVAGTVQYPLVKLRTRLREWFGGADSAAIRRRRTAAHPAPKPPRTNADADAAGALNTDPATAAADPAAVESAPYDAQPGNQSFRAA